MRDIKKNIVYVDDVYHSLLSIKERMKHTYTIYPAQNIEILHDMLYQIVPDLFLIDINMPDTDGFEIARELKDNLSYEMTPVILITGDRDRKNVIKGFDAGADDMLFKPVSDAELIECIDYHLDASKQYADKPKVLAVDDSPVVLKSIYQTLQSDYIVYTLPRPEAIEETLKRLTPDLFILDCHMPVMNGYELLDLLRTKPEHEETPILFLTSDGTKDNLFTAIGHGAAGFIVKPVDEAILLDKVMMHVKDYKKLRILRSLNPDIEYRRR